LAFAVDSDSGTNAGPLSEFNRLSVRSERRFPFAQVIVKMRRRSMSRDAVENMEILLIEDNLENANVTIQYPA